MQRFVEAFWNSYAGFRTAFSSEAAVRLEISLLLIAIPLSFFVSNGTWQQVALIVSILLILAIELLNTCVEKLCDHVTPEQHPQIKIVKDMGSAAVFCASCIAGLVWLAALAERAGLL